MAGALQGLRVLDFTWALAGPFATTQLADLGAEVVRVERTGMAEHQRGLGPYVDGLSTFFFATARGKKGICIDLASPAGADIARRLAAEADVVVNNFRPGTMERHGLGYEDLRASNPGLIWAAISGYGQTGPSRHLPSADPIAQAMGGTMSLNGYADRGPLRVGAPIGDTVAGLYLAVGILAALHTRRETGLGQAIDVALTEAQMALCDLEIVRLSATGEAPSRQGSRHPAMAPFGPFAAADGYIVVANVTGWPRFCALIGRDDLAADERFRSNRARVANVDDLEEQIRAVFATRTVQDWIELLRESGAGSFSGVNAVPDLFEDPQVAARGALVEVPLPYGRAGTWTLPNSPLRLSGTPTSVGQRMPEYGEHTDDVLSVWLSLGAEEIARLRTSGAVG